jgi:hypothetical protein
MLVKRNLVISHVFLFNLMAIGTKDQAGIETSKYHTHCTELKFLGVCIFIFFIIN